jgi:hypothetical protein
MAKLTKRQEAQALALRGETDAALVAFLDLKKQGNAVASASLAELTAFRGDWGDVLADVEVIFASPTSVEALNVYTDMVGLAAQSIAALQKWEEGEGLASMALEKVSTIPDYGVHVIAVQRLLEFIERKGEGSFFGDRAYFAIGQPSESLEERKRRFDVAVAKAAESLKKRSRPTADDVEHLYALAVAYRYYEGAVQVFDREQGALPRIFSKVSFLASALARAGRHAEAWDAIRTQLPAWWPVTVSQVAPVELLVDEALRAIMTRERCEELLRCPRGPGAQRK